MFEAKVVRNFTWGKRGDKLFKRKDIIKDLTKEDVDYLSKNGVIAEIKTIEILEKEPIEHAVEKPKTEKALKTKKVAKK